jgi:hypothetical protein
MALVSKDNCKYIPLSPHITLSYEFFHKLTGWNEGMKSLGVQSGSLFCIREIAKGQVIPVTLPQHIWAEAVTDTYKKTGSFYRICLPYILMLPIL